MFVCCAVIGEKEGSLFLLEEDDGWQHIIATEIDVFKDIGNRKSFSIKSKDMFLFRFSENRLYLIDVSLSTITYQYADITQLKTLKTIIVDDYIEVVDTATIYSCKTKKVSVISECDYVYPEKSKTVFASFIYKIAYFQHSEQAMMALRTAVSYSINCYSSWSSNNSKFPIIFVDWTLDGLQELFFECIFWGYGTSGTNRKVAMRSGKVCPKVVKYNYISDLSLFPHQLYAFFICRGFHVDYIRTNTLPSYYGISYSEDCDTENSNTTWTIKSIRNLVFHDSEEDDAPHPSVMVLCDWEMEHNKGNWYEVPEPKKSVLSWTAIYNLKQHYVLAQYLKFRCNSIPGTEKRLNGFFNPSYPDEITYMARYQDNK